MSDREIIIDNRVIGDDREAYIVVDIGHNWAGDMKKMLDMIDTAAENGADAVKFQTRHPLASTSQIWSFLGRLLRLSSPTPILSDIDSGQKQGEGCNPEYLLLHSSPIRSG